MKKQLLFILFASVSTLSAEAQMTLNDCLIYARDHAHGNTINRYETKMAKTDTRISAASLLPYVSFGSSGQLNFGRNIDPETNTYTNQKTLGASFALQMSLPVFDGLVRINQLKASRAGAKRQQKSFESQRDQIFLNVIRSFYHVSYCKTLVAQMEEQLLRDQTIFSATQRQEALGTKSCADVAEVKALVAADEYELLNQKNLLSKAYLQLRSDMGMELSDKPLELVENEWTPTRSDSENPQIAEADMALKESLYALRAAKGEFFPDISLNGGISTSYYKLIGSKAAFPTFSKQWHDNMGQYLGVSISFPLFTGLSTVNRQKKAQFYYRQQQKRLEQTRYAVEKETREALMDYSSAIEEHRSAQSRLAAEQLAFAAIARKYELGEVSTTDLYTSSSKLATARANLEGKRIQQIVSRIVLGYYQGEKLIHE